MKSSKLGNFRVPITLTAEEIKQSGNEGVPMGKTTWFKDDPSRTYESTIRLRELVNRTIKRFEARQPIFREAASFREEAASFWATIIEPKDWFTELAADEEYVRICTKLETTITDLQSLMMTWGAQRLRAVSAVSNWFRPSEGLVYKLLATDLKGAVVGDLKLPMAAFYIELPPAMFYNHDPKTGWHELRALTILRGTITSHTIQQAILAGDTHAAETPVGDRLIIEAYCEPNENSVGPFDDSWLFKSYDIINPHQDIETTLSLSVARDDSNYERKLNRSRLGDRILDGLEFRDVLLRFVLNFCVYLGSERATTKPLHEEEIQRLHQGKKFKNLRKPVQSRIRDLQNDKVFLVGTDVTVDHEFKTLVKTGGGVGQALTYRVLVRGHYRNQAHGPKHALRVRKWIEPHVRGADLPTPIVGHTYDVK